MGFWIIPAMIFLPYTTPFNFVWRFESLEELFPPLYIPLLGIILITHTYLLISKRMQIRIIFLWYAILMSLGGYLLGVRLGLVDIRFLPFAQGILVLLAAVGIGESLKGLKAIGLIPAAMLLLTFAGIARQSRLIEHWIAYNFAGFEEKSFWREFREVNRYLRGSVADPRVVYEHSARHEGAGTVRAFELLPLFSGRSTLEGLYMQSSITSPFVYYIQSEISQQGSHPLMFYNYPRFDLKRAVKHLTLFNVSQFITITDETQRQAIHDPSFELEKELFPYKIFKIKENENRYVSPLKYKPLFIGKKGWKRHFFDWFRWHDNPVFLISADQDRIPSSYQLSPFPLLHLNQLPAEPLEDHVTIKERVTNQDIIIDTNKPGHPLLIKVSYHPNWHVQGAERIYLASPSFMIVFPTHHEVRLHYGPGLWNYAGWAASLMGLVLLFIPWFFHQAKLEMTIKKKWRWFLSLALIAGIFSLGFYFHYDAHILYQKGLKHFQEKNYDKAQRLFLKGIKGFPYSPAIDVTYLYYGLCYYKKAQWQEAIDVWTEFMEKFPEGRSIDEMLYHTGLCYRALGQEQKAAAVFNELMMRFPESHFSGLIRK